MRKMSALRLQTDLLLQAGRLLLAYNESTGAIHRALTATARALTDETCHVVVSYRGVAVSLAREGPAVEPVSANAAAITPNREATRCSVRSLCAASIMGLLVASPGHRLRPQVPKAKRQIRDGAK